MVQCDLAKISLRSSLVFGTENVREREREAKVSVFETLEGKAEEEDDRERENLKLELFRFNHFGKPHKAVAHFTLSLSLSLLFLSLL